MSIVAAIPVRSLATGKHRLRPHFNDDWRQALILTLCLRTLRAVAASQTCHTILLISQDAPLLSWMAATVPAIVPVFQPTSGLINALWQGNTLAQQLGATAYLALHADLPLLTDTTITTLVAPLHNTNLPTVVIAGDRHQVGTNALAIQPLGAIPFRFGDDSLQRHRTAAQSQAIHTVILTDPALACDLDDTTDIAYVAHYHAEHWQQLLAEADTWRATAQTIVATTL